MAIIIIIIIIIIIMIIIPLFTLGSITFIALMLEGPIKCLKQKIQIELKRVNEPNWPEAN